MVWPCLENGRRKITQNSIEVDAETKESMRKTEEKLDGKFNLYPTNVENKVSS
jgi:hypothetical protein